VKASRPKARPGIDLQPIQDGVVALDPDETAVLLLNLSAAAILALCDGARSEMQIASEIAMQFGLDEPPTPAIHRCVEALTSAGLLDG
jgi:hypothetical protein